MARRKTYEWPRDSYSIVSEIQYQCAFYDGMVVDAVPTFPACLALAKWINGAYMIVCCSMAEVARPVKMPLCLLLWEAKDVSDSNGSWYWCGSVERKIHITPAHRVDTYRVRFAKTLTFVVLEEGELVSFQYAQIIDPPLGATIQSIIDDVVRYLDTIVEPKPPGRTWGFSSFDNFASSTPTSCIIPCLILFVAPDERCQQTSRCPRHGLRNLKNHHARFQTNSDHSGTSEWTAVD